ncbi:MULTISPECIES: ABC transporter permease [unclassified Colwellia]|jgi:putative ABC transport system permease protein|uniref:ABC transporter permease n=1 Tax=unclassified Colwellia TaxID=196834 RepID=UPI0015F39E13|nr:MULTISPECIES: ABC transporter permease [unclassified Colwellia]MBA6232815.1 ABC transporter permease [Colwellia sp. MB02u-7]MBA6236092.1 ABC transporter permease [Colwellia sp. MB02u-11]MBA6256654.1 ABC transporter permease [Colwellia sp. MB3u-28]MBA6261369.1 ABC transporter permease [Colwellia sp. MB3u-41]MBA6263972.1 ABC transporter permease [Colwellia sp. Bg11-12]
MKYLAIFLDTFSELAQHKLRTLLTLLGMIFGVGAVIAMLNIGEGAEAEAMKMIDSMGLHNLIIEGKVFEEKELQEQRKHSTGLSIRDGEISASSLPFVTAFSAQKLIDTYSIFSGEGKSDGEATGVSASFFALSKFNLAQGRLLNETDDQNFSQVALLGSSTAKQLFPQGNAIGQNIKINHLWFKVVGVLQAPFLKKQEFQGIKLGGDQRQVFIPLKTAIHKFASKKLASEVTSIKLKLDDSVDPISAAKAVSHLLDRRHNEVDDYNLVIPAALLAQQKQTQQIFNIVMSCVAGISLLVGGIGIMNIMLATVLERTKEIGLLRAVGATQKDIRLQFIAESFTISIMGGILGVFFGIMLSELIALYSEWAVSWSTSAIILSFSICALVGLTFGVYPAIKASKLDPIDALQSD